MTLLQAILFGVVEGITEFLPVSSTAHLLLLQKLLGIPATEAVKTFDIAIQSGAILAALLVGWKTIKDRRELILFALIAFVPTALIGFLLHSVVRGVLFQSTDTMLLALVIGGVVLNYADNIAEKAPKTTLNASKAFIIGVCQAIALIPGVSRSGATIVGGLALGIPRKEIVAFSFLLAIPTIAGATALDLLKHWGSLRAEDLPGIGVGFITALIVGFASLRWLLKYIENHSLRVFGIYRCVVAVILALVL